MLYGWAARAPIWRGEADAELIVAEGYMDVIALHRAGFGGAVAPLGTALTEAQMHELWRLAPEPVLCFDGDAAGQRAALRALERALPMLQAGPQPALCTLPAGEDPDSLIRRQGPPALTETARAGTRPLVDVMWRVPRSPAGRSTRPNAAPGWRTGCASASACIADRAVQDQYFRRWFRDKLWSSFRPARFRPGHGGRRHRRRRRFPAQDRRGRRPRPSSCVRRRCCRQHLLTMLPLSSRSLKRSGRWSCPRVTLTRSDRKS